MLEYSGPYIYGVYMLKGWLLNVVTSLLLEKKANGMVAWYECLNLLPMVCCVGE